MEKSPGALPDPETHEVRLGSSVAYVAGQTHGGERRRTPAASTSPASRRKPWRGPLPPARVSPVITLGDAIAGAKHVVRRRKDPQELAPVFSDGAVRRLAAVRRDSDPISIFKLQNQSTRAIFTQPGRAVLAWPDWAVARPTSNSRQVCVRCFAGARRLRLLGLRPVLPRHVSVRNLHDR